MRSIRSLLVVAAFLAVAALPALGQQDTGYKLESEPAFVENKIIDGKPTTLVTVKFTLSRQGQQVDAVDTNEYRIFIYEETKKVAEVEVPRPKVARDVSVVLAVDTSGSMTQFGRMAQAKAAAKVFFRELPESADAGLILFDHQILKTIPLSKDRAALQQAVDQAKPSGGTAYFDACMKAMDMLKDVPRSKERAVVVMTDGVDLNSTATMSQVISKAQQEGIRIYTIGIGEPGKQTNVTTVLALDRSASMLAPATEGETVSKLDALKIAAARFVHIIPESDKAHVKSAVLDFGDTLRMPSRFTNDKGYLLEKIKDLKGEGETAIFDATYAAVMALEAEGPPGKRAVIGLTDGIDNSSRHRHDEVIKRARDAKVPLFMLGFGRKGEIDEDKMKQMAQETGGAYFHAGNQKDLLKIFEDLSIQLHDDGIDEVALTRLANETKGKYYPAKDVQQLEFVLKTVSQSIQRKEYVITFESRFPRADGLARDVSISLAKRTAEGGFVETGEKAKTGYQRRGLVLAQMSPVVYLAFLALFGALILIPVGIGKMTRKSADK